MHDLNARSTLQAKKNLDAARHIESCSGFHSLDNTVGREILLASTILLCIKVVIKWEAFNSTKQSQALHFKISSTAENQYCKLQEIPKTR